MMMRRPLLSDSLYDLVFWLPQRLRLQHNAETSLFTVQVYLKNQWRSIYELGTSGCYPTEIFSDSTLEYVIRQEIEKKGWIWNVAAQSSGSSDTTTYTAQVSKEDNFLYAPTMTADSSSHALCLALLNMVKS